MNCRYGVRHSAIIPLLSHYLSPYSLSADTGCQVKDNSYIPCRAHAVSLPCRDAKGLDCLSHFIYTVRPCLTHSCFAAPVLCHDHAILKASSQGHGTVWHGYGMVL
jgi:hypothetical protein